MSFTRRRRVNDQLDIRLRVSTYLAGLIAAESHASTIFGGFQQKLTPMSAYYFSYNNIHRIICQSSTTIRESDFAPDYLLAIAGGGMIPARILRTYLPVPILTINLSRYASEVNSTQLDKPIQLQWLEPQLELSGKKILVVDEVDDERVTLETAMEQLIDHYPNTEFGIFVVHSKNKAKKGHVPASIKHFFVGQTIEDHWINYAWDAEDIDQFAARKAKTE